MQEPFKDALRKLLDQYATADLEQVVDALEDEHDRLEDELLRQLRSPQSSDNSA